MSFKVLKRWNASLHVRYLRFGRWNVWGSEINKLNFKTGPIYHGFNSENSLTRLVVRHRIYEKDDFIRFYIFWTKSFWCLRKVLISSSSNSLGYDDTVSFASVHCADSHLISDNGWNTSFGGMRSKLNCLFCLAHELDWLSGFGLLDLGSVLFSIRSASIINMELLNYCSIYR